jgi:hypothetical protein
MGELNEQVGIVVRGDVVVRWDYIRAGFSEG